MEEPSVLLHLSVDRDDAARIEIGRAEVAAGFQLIEDRFEHPALPAGGLAVVGNTVGGVPTATVLFPWHPRFATDLSEIQVSVPLLGDGLYVEHVPVSPFAGSQHRAQQFSGPRPGLTSPLGRPGLVDDVLGGSGGHDPTATGTGLRTGTGLLPPRASGRVVPA